MFVRVTWQVPSILVKFGMLQQGLHHRHESVDTNTFGTVCYQAQDDR